MAFTDNDLKRLKETTQVFDYLKSTHFDIEALLNRLEAAEVVCALKEMHVCSICAGSLKLWSKSKGEG